MSQVIQLLSLTEKEEEAILSVLEEDLKLQKEEERRVQYVITSSNVATSLCTYTVVGTYVMILQASR